MPTSFDDFARQMRQIEIDLDQDVNKVKRKVALQALSNVVKATPVDTGRARGNWQAGNGFPVLEELETEDKGGAVTIATGAATIADAQFDQTIFLSNNVPYIVVLDGGSSKQAPANFVNIALEQAVASIEGARLL